MRYVLVCMSDDAIDAYYGGGMTFGGVYVFTNLADAEAAKAAYDGTAGLSGCSEVHECREDEAVGISWRNAWTAKVTVNGNRYFNTKPTREFAIPGLIAKSLGQKKRSASAMSFVSYQHAIECAKQVLKYGELQL